MLALSRQRYEKRLRVVKPSDKNDRNDWSVLFSTVVLPNKAAGAKEAYSWEANKPF